MYNELAFFPFTVAEKHMIPIIADEVYENVVS